MKLIATGGIRDDYGGGGSRKLAYIAGIFKVVKKKLRMHFFRSPPFALVFQLSLMMVVAAVIERNGKILIGQRKRTARHALKWEFPGGKVEPGEDERAALRRELREELAIEAEIGREMDRYEVQYNDGPRTLLIFLLVTKFDGEPQNLDFEQIAWATRAELMSYDFLEGDIPFNSKLAEKDGL